MRKQGLVERGVDASPAILFTKYWFDQYSMKAVVVSTRLPAQAAAVEAFRGA
jgi:hypothetical protein